jgi:hypothetical protein
VWQVLSDALPLIDRKLRLRSVVPQRGLRLLYCDHVKCDGEGLFRLACEHDIEGIVAKRKQGPYLPEQQTSWVKIRNRSYSQWIGREELFERDRVGDLDYRGWDGCVVVCAARNELLYFTDRAFDNRVGQSQSRTVTYYLT